MKRTTCQLLGVLLALLAGVSALLLSGTSPVRLAAQAQAPAVLVIDGGTLIDGNGGAPVTDTVVVIQGDRITSVSRRGQASIPANAQVIRADGKFILPGLWDSQVSYNWYYGKVMLNCGITSTGPTARTLTKTIPNDRVESASNLGCPRARRATAPHRAGVRGGDPA